MFAITLARTDITKEKTSISEPSFLCRDLLKVLGTSGAGAYILYHALCNLSITDKKFFGKGIDKPGKRVYNIYKV